ncbi:MAG: aminotransferase class V-fold PLP-dependent enzyme [Hyphomicrobiaceae bacterium]|nr:aminotransferase class V-fold PLP-dependent enzyme [Hyphomicrobiaceae bacterium]
MPSQTTYLNAASHGLPDETVRERMLAHIRRESEAGPFVAAREVEEEVNAVRQKAADLIGADTAQTAFAQTTMSGWSAAVSALPLKGSRILVTPDEWGECAQILSQLGAPDGLRLEVMPTTQGGDIDLAALKTTLDDDVAAISMPMVSSLRGRRLPVEEVGSLPRPDHCFFIVDGAQALGQLPVDVKRINCDIFAATARKWLRSARGTAILYVRPSALDRMAQLPILDATGTPSGNEPPDIRRFESFDYVVALRLALGTAIDVLNRAGIAAVGDTIRRHALHVRDRVARAGLQLADPEEPQSGITSFFLPGGAVERVSQCLDAEDIVVKFPPFSDEPMQPAPSDGTVLVRVSPHVYNQADEIDALFDRLDATV